MDAKQSMNVGIFPKLFENSPWSIEEDIHQGKSEHDGPEALREFLKLLPESEDMKKLKALGEDMAKLSWEDPLKPRWSGGQRGDETPTCSSGGPAAAAGGVCWAKEPGPETGPWALCVLRWSLLPLSP